MGDRTQKSAAAVLDVSLPTLRKLLAGKALRADVRAKIDAKAPPSLH
jgi:hypothetical protein